MVCSGVPTMCRFEQTFSVTVQSRPSPQKLPPARLPFVAASSSSPPPWLQDPFSMIRALPAWESHMAANGTIQCVTSWNWPLSLSEMCWRLIGVVAGVGSIVLVMAESFPWRGCPGAVTFPQWRRLEVLPVFGCYTCSCYTYVCTGFVNINSYFSGINARE